MTDPTSTTPGDRPVIKRADAVAGQEVAAGKGTRIQLLIGEGDGAPNFAMRRFRMEEGGGMPRHTNEVEHEQFVLAGRARMRIGDTEHEVSAGDVLYIPARMPHDYRVVEGPFEFLCMVPNQPDTIRILDADE